MDAARVAAAMPAQAARRERGRIIEYFLQLLSSSENAARDTQDIPEAFRGDPDTSFSADSLRALCGFDLQVTCNRVLLGNAHSREPEIRGVACLLSNITKEASYTSSRDYGT